MLKIDMRPIEATDKRGKYHQFSTILREPNIAQKETAFEVLVVRFALQFPPALESSFAAPDQARGECAV